MRDALRDRPGEQTMRWVAESIGVGSRVASLRRLTLGGWHVNHAVTVIDRHANPHRLVLRRWARPEWEVQDPDLTAGRERAVLELLATSTVPAPRLVAADPDAIVCDVPALLISRLPGRSPGLPADMGSFLAQLAAALRPIHAIDAHARQPVPEYQTYHDLTAASPPDWSQNPGLWERALDLARTDPAPGRSCFIHRDYHPENTLWSRGGLTGIVDWIQASWGPAAVDTAHMRWNLAITYGLDAADEFLRIHQSLAGTLDGQSHWDLVTVLDVMIDLDPADWPRFDLQRLERYLQNVIKVAG